MSNNSNQINNKTNQDKNKQTANNGNRQKDSNQPTAKSNNQSSGKNEHKNGSNNNNSQNHITGQLKDEFELREKRLKLVYKNLYVVAAVWAALFISYASDVSESAPLYCGLLSALTTSILNILYYIFDELRCMKIYKSAEDATKESADNSFLEIWSTFGFSLCLSILLAIFNISYSVIINQWSILGALLCGMFALSINTFLEAKKDKNNKIIKFKILIRNIATPVVCYTFFAVTQLAEVVANA